MFFLKKIGKHPWKVVSELNQYLFNENKQEQTLLEPFK